jgi:hypothetical protein
MSTLAVVLLATCSWASPGANPYQGAPAAAVDHYTDIAPAVRARLKARIERRQYDDVAAITRDDIRGAREYTDLRQMHFGKKTVCGQPDRSAWRNGHVERGLVYCEGSDCLIVPTVCRNVSRVTRVRQMAGAPVLSGSGGGGSGFLPLGFAPPAAVTSFESMVVADPVLAVSRQADVRVAVASWAPVGGVYLLPAPVPVVPEPGTWLLMVAGLVTLALRRKG